MSSNQLPEEAMHRILQQIQATAIESNRQLQMVKAQLQGRERDLKLNELATKQLNDEGDVPLYRGVGKMFVMDSKEAILADNAKKDKELKDDIANLNKKMKFLEKQAQDAAGHMRDFFSNVEQQRQAQAAS